MADAAAAAGASARGAAAVGFGALVPESERSSPHTSISHLYI